MTKFNFKKKYGQNFLNDENIANNIVNSIEPTEKDLIIEIGPGAGAITKKLKKYGTTLLAFEIDEDTKKYLLPLEDEHTKIIYGDFLEVDVKKYINSIKYSNIYIVGNLPYYITTPIIERIIDLNLNPEKFVIMVQREVADRFLARPKTRDYGYMTVLLNYHFNLSKIIDVPRNKFYPTPNVDSTVLSLSTKDKESVDYEKFKNLLKHSFQFKRKNINNNLKSYNLKIVEKILKKHGYDLTNRAEEIDLETFIDLSNNL